MMEIYKFLGGLLGTAVLEIILLYHDKEDTIAGDTHVFNINNKWFLSTTLTDGI